MDLALICHGGRWPSAGVFEILVTELLDRHAVAPALVR